MKVLCVVDWPEQGRWLWDYLDGFDPSTDRVDCYRIQGTVDKSQGLSKFLNKYPQYFVRSLGILKIRHDYDVIVGSDPKTFVPVALLKSLVGWKAPKLVALNNTVRGPITRVGWLLRFAMRSVDVCTYVSPGERDYSHNFLRLPPEKARIVRIGFTPREHIERYFENPTCPLPKGSFVFAAGRSFRDYKTLFEAVRGLDVKVVVNTRAFCLEGLEIPDNVQVNDMMAREEYYGMIAHSKFVVVPLQKTPHGSGESHLTETMPAGRAVIVTRNPSTQSYVEDGVTGLLVEPGDAAGMRAAIERLLDHPEEAEAMGRRRQDDFEAEFSYESYARNVDRLLREVCGESARPTMPLAETIVARHADQSERA